MLESNSEIVQPISVDVLAAMNNDALPKERQDEAHILLSDALKDLDRLDDEIARVESILDRLRAQRVDNLARIDLYRSAIAPQRNLPNEILSMIFLQGFPAHIAIPIHPSIMPWLAGRVCSKWRQVSIGTPALWADVHIDNDKFHRVHEYECLNASTTAVISRSRSVALSVELCFRSLRPSSTLVVILPDYHRLHWLSLEGYSSHFRLLLTLPGGSVDNLEELFLAIYDQEELIWPVTVFNEAKTLRRLSWTTKFIVPKLVEAIPWSQLTYLDLVARRYALHPSAALMILRHCISLVECIVETDSRSTDLAHIISELGITVLPALLKLTAIFWSTMNGPGGFLTCLDFPSLRHFEGQRHAWQVAWDPIATPTITRSGWLESLTFTLKIGTEALGDLLEQTPALISLKVLEGETIPDPKLELMKQGMFLPHVRVFEVLVDSYASLNKHLDMVEERQSEPNSATDIIDVRFTMDSAFTQETFAANERADRLSRDGRTVRLKFNSP